MISGTTDQNPSTSIEPADRQELAVQRRRLLRGGALLAGVAATTVGITSATAPRAAATDGDAIKVGGEYSGTTTTSLKVHSSDVPALGLINDLGPALYLAPLPTDWKGNLDTGEIAGSDAGPLIGVAEDDDAAPITTYLATGLDLAALPTPVPYEQPDRALDTRSARGRERVLQTSSSPYDSSSRLKAGAWLDVAIDVTDAGYTVEGAFLNVTSIDSSGDGFLATYKPGPRPQVATTRYLRGQVATSSAFMALGVVRDAFAVRVYASAVSHVIIDVTGVSVTALPGPTATPATKTSARRRGSAAIKPRLGLRRSR